METATFSTWKQDIRMLDQLERELERPVPHPPVMLELLRHGETTTNADNLVTGSLDADLTDRGRRQALAAGDAIRGSFDVAFDSGMARSRLTLRLALGAAGTVSPPTLSDCRLAERCLGSLEGLPAEPVPAYDRGDLAWAPPGGETYLDVAARVLSFLCDVGQVARDAGRPLRVLVCSHMGPMRILAATLGRVSDPTAVLTARFPNARLTRLQYEAVAWPAFLRG